MIQKETKENVAVLHVAGKLDSSNAAQFETEAFSAIEGCTGVILELGETSYIASAALRVLLKLRKVFGELTLTNVSSEVYEILQMTGFTEMMKVQRRRRQLSTEGCTEIARGAMGVIYRVNQDTILKVFNSSVSLDSLYQGQEILKQLFIHDIPCAIPFDIVDVGNSYGCVFEMIDADTLSQYIVKHPDETEKCGRRSAELLKALHAKELPAGMLPDVRTITAGWMEELRSLLPVEDANAIQILLDGMKDSRSLLHLDFHPGNIMIRGDELIIIDLDDACVGDPAMDIASLLMTVGCRIWTEEESEQYIGLSLALKDRYARAFFRTYYETEDDEEVERRLRPLWAIAGLRTLYAIQHRGEIPSEIKEVLSSLTIGRIHESLVE